MLRSPPTPVTPRRSIQGGEGTADSGIDDKEFKVLTNWRGHERDPVRLHDGATGLLPATTWREATS
jgi:hypothetical protein